MKGFATPEGTHDYHKNQSVHPDKKRSLDSLVLSAEAVGTYLGDSTDAVDRLYEEALVFAGQNGVNFFDTAINYRCQRSERNIAYALRKLAGSGFSREQFFVSTKGGFLPANGNPDEYRNYVLQTFLNTGLITPDDIVENCHCMTPAYMQAQIDLSLENLKLSTIDLYYLHNPETQLRKKSQKEFYLDLAKVFEVFEKNVSEGKIKSYGLATWNGFRESFGSATLLDLERVIETARSVAGDNHHFRAIQLPYNFAMLEAVGIQNQKIKEEDYPIIPTAVHHGVHVMISAPLMQSSVLELPDEFYDHVSGDLSPIQKALQFVSSSPGVVSAMVGMKNLDHVKENLAVLNEPNWDVEQLQNVTKMLVH